MKRTLTTWVLMISLLVALLPSAAVHSAPLAQSGTPEARAQAILAELTPEERVGQLFVVTFKGQSLRADSQIYDLLVNHSIGGVVLKAANDNFTQSETPLQDIYALNRALQTAAYDAMKAQASDPAATGTSARHYIPLFIGISQEGDQYPYDQILQGVTALPNLMAVGATWDTELAERVGSILGRELSALGFNFLLGPSLDVLDVVRTEGSEDLGTRTFGGDPFWVGEMGEAYIKGIHNGSSNRMMVIASHFPGRGSSDRLPEEEVATVRKSLEQLKQIELAPFFNVTGGAATSAATTDGLLLSHIRYQGFQGNIRATTRPVSFDSAALEQLLALEPFATWRQTGGLVVSDDLGSTAVRRFFDPTNQLFDARQVARNAFLAGNDLLYMDNFIATGDPDTYTTIVRTLESFTQKYIEDPAFAQRVDEAVMRILTMKFRLYSSFEPDLILPAEGDLDVIGKGEAVVFEVARKAATLISPSAADLDTVMPRPPELRDRIVFLTDTPGGRMCSRCLEEPVMAVDALQNAVLRLYGPTAGGQVQGNRMSSYSFSDLLKLLDDPEEAAQLAADLTQTDWIIVSMLDVNPDRPASMALQRFFSMRPDLLRNKRVVVFAFNAPYYLDATDISKLTAYYAMYSKSPVFIELAARILFQEITPQGALPVSVPGVGYDLIEATSPDPNRIIELRVDLPQDSLTPTADPSTLPQPMPTPAPAFRVGDTIPLRTGVILDHNGNVVPDGTVVRFLFTTGSDVPVQQVEAPAIQGVARTAYRIVSKGPLDIRVVSDPAMTSEILKLEITGDEAAPVTAVVPTIVVWTPTPQPEPTQTSAPTLQPTMSVAQLYPHPRVGDWLAAIVLVWGGAAAIAWWFSRQLSRRWGLRVGLLTASGGLLGYCAVALRLFGAPGWNSATSTILLAVVIGMMVGAGGGVGWHAWMKRQMAGRTASRISSTKS